MPTDSVSASAGVSVGAVVSDAEVAVASSVAFAPLEFSSLEPVSEFVESLEPACGADASAESVWAPLEGVASVE